MFTTTERVRDRGDNTHLLTALVIVLLLEHTSNGVTIRSAAGLDIINVSYQYKHMLILLKC